MPTPPLPHDLDYGAADGWRLLTEAERECLPYDAESYSADGTWNPTLHPGKRANECRIYRTRLPVPEPMPEQAAGPIIAVRQEDSHMQTGVVEFTVARLYNTGRYEHSRYELKVNVGFGARASDVFRNLEAALDDLDPKCPVDDYELSQARTIVDKPVKDLTEYERQQVEASLAVVDRYAKWRARRDAAIARLDELGKGSLQQEHKDAEDNRLEF